MDQVNQTLYIPLYGKAFVSRKRKILCDKKAEQIWEKEGFSLKGKSRSKWLAYYMAMRAAVFDRWVKRKRKEHPDAAVLHIGCGMDSRVERLKADNCQWYDIDFPAVINERKKYYKETEMYHMIGADVRTDDWIKKIRERKEAIIIMEGVSMYFRPEELKNLLSCLLEHFCSVSLLMDCYTKKGAKLTKYKNPINDVGVHTVYGYEKPEEITEQTDLVFLKRHNMTPEKMIQELDGGERILFRIIFAGSISKKIYRLYEYQKV